MARNDLPVTHTFHRN